MIFISYTLHFETISPFLYRSMLNPASKEFQKASDMNPLNTDILDVLNWRLLGERSYKNFIIGKGMINLNSLTIGALLTAAIWSDDHHFKPYFMHSELKPKSDDKRREPSLEQKNCLQNYVPTRTTNVIINNFTVKIASAHIPVNFDLKNLKNYQHFLSEKIPSEPVGILPGIILNVGRVNFKFTVPMYGQILIPMLSSFVKISDIPSNLIQYLYNTGEINLNKISLEVCMFNISDGNIATEKSLVCYPINDFKIDYKVLLLQQFWKLSDSQKSLKKYEINLKIPDFQIDLTYPIVQYFWRFIGEVCCVGDIDKRWFEKRE